MRTISVLQHDAKYTKYYQDKVENQEKVYRVEMKTAIKCLF
jgi:hypothetical protein